MSARKIEYWACAVRVQSSLYGTFYSGFASISVSGFPESLVTGKGK